MEPIHKFNSGMGATLCNVCSRIITEGLTDDLYCEEHKTMKSKTTTMEFKKRNSAFTELKEFCYLSGDNDYMEVTEWSNGEGFDINISDKSGEKTMPMTFGEYDALKKLIKFLNKQAI